jgi:hypothetical protein
MGDQYYAWIRQCVCVSVCLCNSSSSRPKRPFNSEMDLCFEEDASYVILRDYPRAIFTIISSISGHWCQGMSEYKAQVHKAT